jgi:hypothetical protein
VALALKEAHALVGNVVVKEEEGEEGQKETTPTIAQATTPSPLKKKRSHDDLARQVNRFSHEELEYLEHKFLQFPTPNIEERGRIAKELSDRRLEKDLNIKDLSQNSKSNFSYIRGQGLMPTELTQVQIKYWFDHQRRKMKKLKMSHSQFTRGIQPNLGGMGALAAGTSSIVKEEGKGCVAAFVNSPQVLSYGPTGPHSARIHTNKSPAPAGACETMLTRPSPTGVLPPQAFSVNSLMAAGGGGGNSKTATTAAALGQLALSYGQQINHNRGQPQQIQQPGSAFCMPMATLPMTPPPNPQAVAAQLNSLPAQSPLGVPPLQLEMLKYIQSLSMMHNNSPMGNTSTNKTGNSIPQSLQQFKVASWGPNDVVLPRDADLDRGIFLLNGNLKVLYYASKDDPTDRPAYSMNVAEGSYFGRFNGTSNSQAAGGMLIQAQTHCYCALVDQ